LPGRSIARPVEEKERAGPQLSRNEILPKLPTNELDVIVEHAEEISCPLRQVLFDQGDKVELVYFPLTGMASLVIVLQDGTAIESTTVGREGFVGTPLLNGVLTARYRGICQVEGTFLVLNARIFISIIDDLPELKRRLLRYSQFSSEVAAQSAACNSIHNVEQRCARWLLITADGTGTTTFSLTHEFLSQMLAVRRPGVTVVIGSFVRKALVTKSYGKVTLLDVEGLKKVSCECYATIRSKARELLA
jgi:CRP-like cAMP-binding protein